MIVGNRELEMEALKEPQLESPTVGQSVTAAVVIGAIVAAAAVVLDAA